MKRIMILGASILQLPAIRKAKEMGCYVGVVDYNADAVGVREADEFYNISTIDVDGVVRVAQCFHPDGIMTLASDMPMRSVAEACKVLKLPGISPDTALKATDKGEMIKAFEAKDVAHPWYIIVPDPNGFEKVLNNVSFPCIMKPTDNSGSRGVVLCENRERLKAEYEYALHESRGGAVIIEEFLRGPEFSVEVMVVDGHPYVLQITDKMTTGAPHFVEMGHSQPTQQNEENQELIRELACKAVSAVGINVGPAHVEIILTKDGPKMVELGARMGGDCIATHLVPLSTGVDMVENSIKLACGEKVDITPKFKKGAAIRYFDTCNGKIKRIDGIDFASHIPGVKEIAIVHQIGETIRGIGNSADRVGFVIAQQETVEKAIDTCLEAIQSVRITME